PQNLRTSEPQNLRTSEPQNLRTSEPQNLSIAPEQISFALKAVRLEQGLSQTTLAKRTHFQLTAISLREQTRYQSYPALSTLEIYCKAFGITVSSFLCYAASLSCSAEEAIS
ncbi:MAG: helix-turn-helix transcriptional regulator, partial [Sphaerochaeta sp.]